MSEKTLEETMKKVLDSEEFEEYMDFVEDEKMLMHPKSPARKKSLKFVEDFKKAIYILQTHGTQEEVGDVIYYMNVLLRGIRFKLRNVKYGED